eukprot:GHUV01030626.1.p1 GENE.GHUV01030626.1~~GHUV01030626.1.p1  ORF type:complete len:122 (-),score=29.75 GHUV01030626.1:274-639(-)
MFHYYSMLSKSATTGMHMTCKPPTPQNTQTAPCTQTSTRKRQVTCLTKAPTPTAVSCIMLASLLPHWLDLCCSIWNSDMRQMWSLLQLAFGKLSPGLAITSLSAGSSNKPTGARLSRVYST